MTEKSLSLTEGKVSNDDFDKVKMLGKGA